MQKRPSLIRTEVTQVPKRPLHIAGHSASLPTAAVAVRSRRAERQARRKRERALLRKAFGGSWTDVY
jgi:hypothetical protein